MRSISGRFWGPFWGHYGGTLFDLNVFVLRLDGKPLITRNGKRVEIKELLSMLEKVFDDDE